MKIVTLAFALSLLISFSANAETISIAGSEFPPFKYTENGKVIGTDTEIIAEVMARMGHTADFKIMPWKRAEVSTAKGDFHAVYSFTKNPDRLKKFYFSDPLSTVTDVFFKLKGNDISWDSYSDLSSYRIGAASGYNYDKSFLKALRLNIFQSVMVSGEAPEFQLMKMLKAGRRIDLFICEVSVCNAFIKQSSPRYDMLDYINKPVGEIRTFHIGFSQKWPKAKEFRDEFNTVLQQFVAEGNRSRIFKKYGATCNLPDCE